AVGLSIQFGIGSFLATSLPFLGIKLYRAAHYGLLTTGMEFLSPPSATIRYFFASRAAWWLVGSIVLLGLGCRSAICMLRAHELEPRHLVVLLCSVLQWAFALGAYGAASQHVIYDPIIVVGT